MAAASGAFAGFARNREPMLRVMRMHRDAAYEIDRDASLLPGEAGGAASNLYRAACDDWDEAVRLGEILGYRNAQATVLAPTGTIGLLMDVRHDRHRARLRPREIQEARLTAATSRS